MGRVHPLVRTREMRKQYLRTTPPPLWRRCARPQAGLSPRTQQQLPSAPRPVRQEHQWHAPRFRTRYEIWIPAPRWQPYRDGNSAGPCDESYIERDVGQLAGSDSRGNHCQDADKPRTTENRMPQFRLSFAMRSEEHTSELQSLMRISYAVFGLQKKKTKKRT